MQRACSLVRCREIEAADLDEVIDLLTDGYHKSRRDFWARRIERLSQYDQPAQYPKYGYLLACNNRPVGAIFSIFARVAGNGIKRMRCCLGSWYVKAEFRSYAVMLAARALKHDDVTYVNITPNPHVIPILEAQGYVRFCGGRMVAVPLLSRRGDDAYVAVIASDSDSDGDLLPTEMELLQQHARFGCFSVMCCSADIPLSFNPAQELARYGSRGWCIAAISRTSCDSRDRWGDFCSTAAILWYRSMQTARSTACLAGTQITSPSISRDRIALDLAIWPIRLG
jgi:hypothetical protein